MTAWYGAIKTCLLHGRERYVNISNSSVGRCRLLTRQVLIVTGPQKLCVDGTYGVNATHFAVSEIDIFSDHFYPLNTTILESDIAAVKTADRVYLAGEIDWTGLNGGQELQGDSLASFYDVILARQNDKAPVVAGSLFWSLFGHDVPDCSVSF